MATASDAIPGSASGARNTLTMSTFVGMSRRLLKLFSISPAALLWTLVECVGATIAGAWLYREAEG